MAVYDDQMYARGFPGMKCDSGDDRVESFPAIGAVPFGRVVATNPATLVTTSLDNVPAGLPAAPLTKFRGVALHSHLPVNNPEGYAQYDCMSVMTRGLAYVECAASTALTIDGPLSVDTAGRAVAAAGTVVPNAAIRGNVQTGPDGKFFVAVEFHSPMIDAV